MSDNLRNIGENHPGTQPLKIEDPDMPALPLRIFHFCSACISVYKFHNVSDIVKFIY